MALVSICLLATAKGGGLQGAQDSRASGQDQGRSKGTGCSLPHDTPAANKPE